jgi:putative ABC transport system substrate-binding protein
MATAQPAGHVWRLGVLNAGAAPSAPSTAARLQALFWQALRELGWIEGQNLIVEQRSAEGSYERLPELAAELVRLNVDVIVAVTTPAALAAKHATHTIPIVFTDVGDPIGAGLITGLARPGENITGLTSRSLDLDQRRLELLKEAVPGFTRVACLWNPTNPANVLALQRMQADAQALGVQLQPVEVQNTHDMANALVAITHEYAEALFVHPDPFITLHSRQIVDFATQRHLPAIYGAAQFVEAGGLLVYMTDSPDLVRRTAVYVDKILKGAKPADLPVEQPMKFKLVVNLKAAKELGLSIPPTLLFQADEVIQ